MTGRVILLHGTSSSGKSTVARAIQALSDDPWIRLGIDAVWNAVDERWMEHGSRSAEGFHWSEDGTIAPGPVGQRIAAGMRAAVAALARAGNDVVADDVFVDPGWLSAWRAELTGIRLLLVGVFAPLHLLEERERSRGNRISGEARAQFEVIHRGVGYDITVDTSDRTPEQCARAILNALAT